MYNYKGIFYKEEKEKIYYEGGAHFSYLDLVSELNKLIKERNRNTDDNRTKDSKSNILFLSNNHQHLLNEGQKSKSLVNKQNKINLNFLTLNNKNVQYKKRMSINKGNQFILNTEKSNENKEISNKSRLLTLISKNLKISPLKTNINNNKNVNSLEKNYNMKTLENKSHKNDYLYKNISLYINHNKERKGNNLPIIKDFHYNNFSNRNIFKAKQNNLYNLKFDSKIETSKYNLFLKNKAFSPLKNIQANIDNKILSLDFSDSKYNKNTIDAVTSNKNKIYFNKGKLKKYLRDEINKPKGKPNINIINFIKKKKE